MQYGPRPYATNALFLGSSLRRFSRSSTGIDSAPAMCPAAYSPRRPRVQDDDVAGPAAAEQLLFSPCLRLSTRHAARSAFRCWDTLATERVVSWARESTVRSPW